MCGIVATIGSREAASLLLQGLQRLEYRGYDSAGLATVTPGQLHCCKAEGKLVHLREKLEKTPVSGCCGIGHTRWATHGKPDARNAHPQLDEAGSVAVVQNGIIENHRHLRQHLEQQGVHFGSDTDTEVIPHLVAQALADLRGTVPPTDLLRLAVAQVDEINKQYVLTARAKGLNEPRVLFGHVFRNAMLIVIAGFPSAFVGILFTGSVLIEVIFSLEGMGLLSYDAVIKRDYPIMFGTLFVFTFIGLFMHLVGDICYVLVDPRIDFEVRQ